MLQRQSLDIWCFSACGSTQTSLSRSKIVQQSLCLLGISRLQRSDSRRSSRREEESFRQSEDLFLQNQSEVKGRMCLNSGWITAWEGMEEMKEGAKEKAEDSWCHKDKDGPLWYELRVGNFRMQIHNHENIWVDIFFKSLSVVLNMVDKGKVELILKSGNNVRSYRIFIFFLKFLHFFESVLELLFQWTFNSFYVLIKQHVDIVGVFIYFMNNIMIILNYFTSDRLFPDPIFTLISTCTNQSKIPNRHFVLIINPIDILHGKTHLFFKLVIIDCHHERNQQTQKDT